MRFSGLKVISEALRGHKGWEATWRDATPKSHYDYIITVSYTHLRAHETS